MPTPAKTSRDELIGIAHGLVQSGGAEALTVSAVAQAAGVKAPSLYKHFADRSALLRLVEISVLHELESALRRNTRGHTPQARIRSMAGAYRDFAREYPRRYEIIYSRDAAEHPQIIEACRFAAQPLFEELQRACLAANRILPLSRTLTAFLHGFVTMEIANAFHLGGSLDEAFEDGLETLLGGALRS